MLEFTDTLVPDLVLMIKTCFNKILKVNLTFDEYRIIHLGNNEMSDCDNVESLKITDWFFYFVASKIIHPDDVIKFNNFTNIDNLRNSFKEDPSKKLILKYRSKVNDKYEWFMLMFLKSMDYSEDNQNVMLYIRNINDEYEDEINYKKKLEKLSFTDSLTKMNNRYVYNKTIKKYKSINNVNIGVLFIDLNGLKYINDNKGHSTGDELILTLTSDILSIYKEDECYRIGGDEFVIITEIDENNFYIRERKLLDKVSDHEFDIASIGSSYGNSNNIETLLEISEDKMYRNKKAFYKNNPVFNTRKSSNSHTSLKHLIKKYISL